MNDEVKKQLDAVTACLDLRERGPAYAAVVVLTERFPCREVAIDDPAEDHFDPHVVVLPASAETGFARYWELRNARDAIQSEMDDIMEQLEDAVMEGEPEAAAGRPN